MNWIIRKAECKIIDAFKPCCWRRLLRVSWTARRSNQSILKEISPDWKDWCWSWSSNTLIDHLMWRDNSLEKILLLGKIEGKRKGGQQMIWWAFITDSMDMNLRKRWEIMEARGAWCAAAHGVTESDTT